MYQDNRRDTTQNCRHFELHVWSCPSLLSLGLGNRVIGKKKPLNGRSLSLSAKWATAFVGSSSHYFLLFVCSFFPSTFFFVYFVSPFWEISLWIEEAKGKARMAGSCRKPVEMAMYRSSSDFSSFLFPSKQDYKAFCMACYFAEMKD